MTSGIQLFTQNKRPFDFGLWGRSYEEFQVEQFNFNLHLDSVTDADKINISVQADSAKNIFRSDTVSSSRFLLNKMEIQYNDNKFIYFVFFSPVFKNGLDLNDLSRRVNL